MVARGIRQLLQLVLLAVSPSESRMVGMSYVFDLVCNDAPISAKLDIAVSWAFALMSWKFLHSALLGGSWLQK